jgi:hypothetical protein
MGFFLRSIRSPFLVLTFIILTVTVCPDTSFGGASAEAFRETVQILAGLGDRSTGTPGCRSAANFIKEKLSGLDLGPVQIHRYSLPVLHHGKTTLFLPKRQVSQDIQPVFSNAISPQAVAPPGLQGPMIYVGEGNLSDFNGFDIKGSIILMDLDSGKNWLNAVSLGASGLVYLDRGGAPKYVLEEIFELSPVDFPRFWMPYENVVSLFGVPEKGIIEDTIRITSEAYWKLVTEENIYCLIRGEDKALEEELVLFEAFYDSTATIPGMSPGAEEALSIASLLELASHLKQNPPKRSVLILATSGHAQSLAGMREFVWSFTSRSKFMRDARNDFKNVALKNEKILSVLNGIAFDGDTLGFPDEEGSVEYFQGAISERIKTEVDQIAQKLMLLRLERKDQTDDEVMHELAKKRFMLRQLGWRSDYTGLSSEEKAAIAELIPLAIRDHRAILKDAESREKLLKSANTVRSVVKSFDLKAMVSLHLSSHGDGIGAFNQGWMFPLRPIINRVPAYSLLDDVLRAAAAASPHSGLFRDTLRPSRKRPWDSYFLDKPYLGGEIGALAGLHGISLVTVDDGRPYWGTPDDTIDKIDFHYAFEQVQVVCHLADALFRAPSLHEEVYPRDGFSTVAGRAKFLRQGELFPDQAAPGTVILAYQGDTRFYSMVDSLGSFQLRGVADKKHSYHKLILEGYRFDPDTGKVLWAVDKEQTGKNAYRVKMQRQLMETDLVMFACRGTTVFNLLEPRTFNPLTKIKLIDGRRESAPMKYWFSRIDTRQSTIASIFLEPGTPLKLILSDSVIRKKLILTNGNDDHPDGLGYQIDDWPVIDQTHYRVAKDIWTLLLPRIKNLEYHGVIDPRIRELEDEGLEALKTAEESLRNFRFDRFDEASARSWALASRVYDQVEKTQKDVLFGVLFYIALFVPFAFCLERLLFCYTNIYKRIVAFFTILLALIAVIYKVHPAFQLAYSPMVVILAFFIIGLSFMVSLIIFSRFEEEMTRLQTRAHQTARGEVSRWKTMAASFFLGVSNLRRRRIRTGLTCITLIILTFTIMSFTSVKSSRLQGRLLFQDRAAYKGFLLKNVNWKQLPAESVGVITNTFSGLGVVAPRVWLEATDATYPVRIPVRSGNNRFEAQGLIGLSSKEKEVTGLADILTEGEWFSDDERFSALIPDRMAKTLGIDLVSCNDCEILLWGKPFKVVGTFSPEKLQQHPDLDGEMLTPVIFPRETTMEMTEVEIEAMESGEDVKAFQSLYQHIPGDMTLIIPYRTLLSFGGQLKGLAVRMEGATPTQDAAWDLVDRFGLSIFSGEPEGTFLYNASDTLSYSGVPNILIPIAISIFIVLNTMIGSVYERKREIGIYTSVGLAPSHVSFLFIAEALAFAVLSVVLGYIFAQGSASLFSGTSLWSGITVNYSSLAGVAAMILVMLVVLISVIYPSRVAARIAIPDVNRSWKLPPAIGNELEIQFPFLMKYQEHESIGGFLVDYFRGHQDVSHGLFSTGPLSISYLCPVSHRLVESIGGCPAGECHKDACLAIHAGVWLAPFDFGIKQRVTMQFCPSVEEPGYLEIKVTLNRESGEANTWRRINKGFLLSLRKQLLVWRSLSGDEKREYEDVLTPMKP